MEHDGPDPVRAQRLAIGDEIERAQARRERIRRKQAGLRDELDQADVGERRAVRARRTGIRRDEDRMAVCDLLEHREAAHAVLVVREIETGRTKKRGIEVR